MPTIRNASGNPIAITDSASAPLQGLRVLGKTTQKTLTGKNLLNFNTEGRTYFGVTFTANADGSVTCVGTSSADNAFANLNYVDMNTLSIPPGTYIVSGAKDGVAVVLVVDGQAVLWQVSGERTVTIPETAVNSWMRVVVDAAGTTVNTTIYPMIRRVEIVDPTWEPYTGGIPSPNPDYPQPLNSVGDDGAVDVTVAGKNLLPPVQAIRTHNGITFTCDETGAITVNGTATATAILEYGGTTPPDTLVDGQTYWLSGCEGGGGSTYKLDILNVATCYRKSTAFVFDKSKTFLVRVIVYAGTKLNNLIIRPMVAATDDYAYEPYKPTQALTLSAPNGLPGIPVSSGGNYTDEDGQQWVCDEIDLERGVYVQRVKKLTVGTVKEVYENGGVWYAVVRPDAKGKPYHAVSSTHFIGTTGKLNAGNVAVTSTGNIQTALTDQSIQTVDTWNAWLAAQTSPVEIIYILATPVETDLTINEVLAYKALKTNHPNTTIMSNEDAWLYAAYIQQQAGFTTYWTDPKTDWKNGDHFNLDPDYERIKNNITHVQEITNKINARVEIDAMGDYAITEYPLAAFLNTIATNIEKLSKSMFLVTPTAEMPMHVGNGPGWTAEELNDIEGNLLNMYEELNRQYALVPRLDIMMGIGGINFGS